MKTTRFKTMSTISRKTIWTAPLVICLKNCPIRVDVADIGDVADVGDIAFAVVVDVDVDVDVDDHGEAVVLFFVSGTQARAGNKVRKIIKSAHI